jgi:acyl-CoA synthetase (NDP forming)
VKPALQPPVDLDFVFNSQFAGVTQVGGGGAYTVEIKAQQLSIPNAGKAMVNFQVPLC